ncbi:MAG: Gfo/Idh/MocA family oxidoreductase [Planctomycetes bacterium]|nr:Gfo/Idh/MocA family oxidoreductase [Planctomycetota bacterium]
MDLRFAFMGFRHGHIFDVLNHIKEHAGCSTVAVCEEDPATRASVVARTKVTHESYAKLLDEVPCDVVAVGDYFGRRGAVVLEALRRGKHVICDKPLCTSLEELERIETLAREQHLVVACQLGMPAGAAFVRLKELVAAGTLGELHQIAFGGQHPLLWGSRAQWYFEPGKHGGTINDIAIHGIHMLPKVTGLGFKTVVAARAWNAFAKGAPDFKDSAQFMLTLSNGCGVLGDVSYAMPSAYGYKMPQYWRFTLYGSNGVAETGSNYDHVFLCLDQDKAPQKLPLAPKPGKGYFELLLSEIAAVRAGEKARPFTQEVLAATRVALKIQQAADRNLHDAPLS